MPWSLNGEVQADITGLEAQAAGRQVAAVSVAVFDFPDQRPRVSPVIGSRFPGTEQPVHSAESAILTEAFAGAQPGKGIVTAKPNTVFFIDAVLPVKVTAGEVAGEQWRNQVGVDVQAVFDLLWPGQREGFARGFCVLLDRGTYLFRFVRAVQGAFCM